MAFSVTTAEGSVPTWGASGIYASLIAAMTSQTARLTAQAPVADITSLSGDSRVNLPGMGQWTVNLEGLAFSTPRQGNVGLLALSSGTIANLKRWTLTIATPQVHDITAFVSGSPPAWRVFRPDIIEWSGSLTAMHDSSTMPLAPDLASVVAAATSLRTATLTYGLDTAANTFAGAVALEQTGVNQSKGGVVEVDYNFQGSGNLTAAGTNTLLTAGVIAPWLWDQNGSTTNTLLTLTAYTSKTYTGSAFMRSITITCEVGSPVTVSCDIQGTGALTFPT